MTDVEKALAIANLIIEHGPKIVSLVMKFRTDAGEISTVDLLQRAGNKFNENIAKARAALEEA